MKAKAKLALQMTTKTGIKIILDTYLRVILGTIEMFNTQQTYLLH